MRLTNLFVRLAAACFLAGTAHPLCAGENYAFLVAVADYSGGDFRKLDWTRSDILEFAEQLEKSGYARANVVVLHDDVMQLTARYGNLKGRHYLAEAAKIRDELKLLLSGLDEDDSLIVAFSGHGVQLKDPQKLDDPAASRFYFCPIDGSLKNRESMVSLTDVYARLQFCKAARKLLLVDACRDDPLSKDGTKRATVDVDSVTRPEREPPPKGTVALFSCIEGQTSNEIEQLKHGLFFYHVLEGWKGNAVGKRKPDLDGDNELSFEELAQFVKKGTSEYARVEMRRTQTPEFEGKVSGDWVLRKYHDSVTTNSIGMKLVRIPAGEYLRGSPNSDNVASDHEKPQHRVRITKDFYLGQHEVTQGEWKAVMGTEPWKGKMYVNAGKDYPATYVSWDDAQEFCRKLSQKDGRTYRLPTEAEWEYAGRGGTTTQFSFGDDVSKLSDHAWFDENSHDNGQRYAHQVGLKKPNGFDLYDMHGNVWEWCQDWYAEKEYANHAGRTVQDPQGPQTGSFRVIRGGCFSYWRRFARSAFRGRTTPEYRDNNYGFRAASVSLGQ